MSYPQEFICPITQGLMTEPVSLQCGHTFEKSAVETWLASNAICPTCRTQVSQQPIVNYALKSMISSLHNNNAPAVAHVEQEIVSSLEVTDDDVTADSLKGLKLVGSKDKLHLRIDVPKLEKRRPVTFVCVIDVSGSMESPIGKAEGNKIFTRLDIVKHVLSVLISTLHENDNLCLITFSDTSHIVLELCAMNKENKRLAKNYVTGLRTFCNTYTGPALKAAYAEMKKAPTHHVKSIILLTDGHDTAGDDMVLHMFDRIQKTEKIQLNTFGFSNDIKSNCLAALAKQGGGIFGFIPDQSMIGTIFINFLANTFLTFAQDVHLELKSNFDFDFDTQPKKISLQYGQRRYFKIHKKGHYNGSPSLKVGFSTRDMIELNLSSDETISDDEINEQIARCEVLNYTSDHRLPKLNIENFDGLKNITLNDFLSEFKQVGEHDPNHEQLTLCLKYWNTWGAHYLKSFAFAHWFEQCLNFKSPSMKIYRYEAFDKLVDEFTDIFCTLPTPEATGSPSSASNAVPNFSVSNIMDAHGGCILENCKIKMQAGWKAISKVRKNDIVASGAKVLCVIKTVYDGPLIKVGKLVITPYHPIFHANKWIFPTDAFSVLHKCNRPMNVYNLVLDTRHVINVEGVSCITLGHGFTDDAGVLTHPYYGTERVLNELSTFKGWTDGFISIKKFELFRDESNLVYKTIVHEYDS